MKVAMYSPTDFSTPTKSQLQGTRNTWDWFCPAEARIVLGWSTSTLKMNALCAWIAACSLAQHESYQARVGYTSGTAFSQRRPASNHPTACCSPLMDLIIWQCSFSECFHSYWSMMFEVFCTCNLVWYYFVFHINFRILHQTYFTVAWNSATSKLL